MKTVCKKLLCLMLVAMMLVSALPAAFAAETHACPKCGSVNTEDHIGGKEYAATCTTPGKDCWVCKNCSEYDGKDYYFLVDVAKKDHNFVKDEAKSVAATCTVDGVNAYTCECGEEKTETVEASGHKFDSGVVVTESTCTVEGVKKFTCQTCGFGKEEPIALKAHVYGADGKCTSCTATDGIVRYNVTFVDTVAGKVETRTFTNDTTITTGVLPEGSLKDGKQFVGWYNGSNKLENLLQNGKWHAGMPTTFEAKYIDSNDDGVSKLYVYVRFYVGNVQQGYTQLLLDPITFKDGENMFSWLNNNKGTIGDAIAAKDAEGKYQWYPEYFYNYSGNEILTEQNMLANGDKSVVVKAYSKATTVANVWLYVHTSKTSTPAAIYELHGYTAGNTVTLANVKNELKNKYTVTAGLYSDKAWTDMLNGLNPMAVNGIAVETNGITKIHVMAKGGGSNADSSNPKTGDYITIAATAMVLSAAGFVTMVEMKKRKMI